MTTPAPLPDASPGALPDALPVAGRAETCRAPRGLLRPQRGLTAALVTLAAEPADRDLVIA
ncbi:hypothetical protein [Actinomadura atramentaria]|uniref:hypothetical protein n=1 Tax=Actinomadura atramentaria TaxID=1990 RepID=UPI00037B289D|nr:hypothetical protein [Actinomadura atramentaria]